MTDDRSRKATTRLDMSADRAGLVDAADFLNTQSDAILQSGTKRARLEAVRLSPLAFRTLEAIMQSETASDMAKARAAAEILKYVPPQAQDVQHVHSAAADHLEALRALTAKPVGYTKA